MIDFIGDIHGHYDKLLQLLEKLGYEKCQGSYAHPDRKAFFLGDYIDRGKQIPQTLELVRSMVDGNHAKAIMGNHEYNALCFHYQERSGGHLRKHLIKNIIQHYETLVQFQNQQEQYEAYLDWFKTLPLFFETPQFRAVHACWNQPEIDYLTSKLEDGCLNDYLIYQSVEEGTALNQAVEITLKGKEIAMPDGMFFLDKDGTKRTDIRIKWWENPHQSTYKSLSVEPIADLPDRKVADLSFGPHDYYQPELKPVFFGHYWLKHHPVLYRDNICCLDYSVARAGKLVAYRFDGEEKLDNGKLVFV